MGSAVWILYAPLSLIGYLINDISTPGYQVVEAKKKCPELIAVHTATYREGDVEPGYHENPDVRTHKVVDYPLNTCRIRLIRSSGFIGLLSERKQENRRYI